MSRHVLRRRGLAVGAALLVAPLAQPAVAPAATIPSLRVAPDPFAAEAPPVNPLAEAVSAARSRIGSPYAMGATGPGAFDCSGLTTYAFARAEVALPRTSQAQFTAGRAVERDEISSGDLVFFSTNGPGASHVGVATARGTVISATSSGVMEHSMADAYWGAHYVGARRVRR
jgi:cell wall-associated NlpC family hydrolase